MAARTNAVRTPAVRKKVARKKATRKKVARKKAAPKKTPKKTTRAANVRKSRAAGGAKRKWSAQVMRRSDAMDLEQGVFKQRSARSIALSLKKSAERSNRRKSTPFRSAMSMLNFEINWAGKGLTAERRRTLENAKAELRRAFGREQLPQCLV
jgi:Protein of unknown function (DUF3175)